MFTPFLRQKGPLFLLWNGYTLKFITPIQRHYLVSDPSPWWKKFGSPSEFTKLTPTLAKISCPRIPWATGPPQSKELEPKGWSCGWVELNKPHLPCSWTEISARLVHSATSFVHVKNAFMISMHEPGRWSLSSSSQQKNDHSHKEEKNRNLHVPPP